MTTRRVHVLVSPDGSVLARGGGVLGGSCPGSGHVRLTGLNGRLVTLFENWLTDRQRTWELDEMMAFGQLLHRTIFDRKLWSWVQKRIGAPGADVSRLLFGFPVAGEASRLAALPWEYLHAPDDQDGMFLAEDERVVLSRSLPLGKFEAETDPLGTVKVLPVVSGAAQNLGVVDPEPVLATMRAYNTREDFEFLPAETEVSKDSLRRATERQSPDVVHFMGHGRFRKGRGEVALRSSDDDTAWVKDVDFAKAVCAGGAPKVVVMHSCDTGQTDLKFRFAGLAPELVSRGVRNVVAMQYAVDADTAARFSELLYRELALGRPVDVCVQTARRELAQREPRDYRMLGMPMIYLRNATPLLGAR